MSNKARTDDLFQIKNAADIDGLAFRHYRGEEDLPAFVEIHDACNRADSIKESTTVEQLTYMYSRLKNCNPTTDMLIAEVDGKMIAYSRVWWLDEYQGPLAYQSFGYIHPKWRRKGIGTAMLAYNEARQREIAREHPENREKVAYGFAADTQPGTHALFKIAGYEAARYFFMMLRDLGKPIPEPKIPEGLEIRPAIEEHKRQIWEASNEAFRDHWGYTEGTREDYERFANNPFLDPELWKVAWEGDEVAGMVLNKIDKNENKKLGVKYGWTDPISVRRPWRQRGLATALIHASLIELKEQGMEHAALGVDTQNYTGALNLYERAGYVVEEHWTDYKKEMDLSNG